MVNLFPLVSCSYTAAGFQEKDVVLGTTLVDMYAKCGALAKAAQVLSELPARNVVSWNALITGYAQQGQGEEALECFERMQHEGFPPNDVTFICILKACGSIGAADKGQQIHNQIKREGFLVKDVAVGNALVDMYAKCGALSKAARVLDELPIRDVVSWSALIAGYAQQAQGVEALNCLERMQCEGLSPNAVTLASTLASCSRSGQLDEGQMFLTNMCARYGIVPDLEHQTSMVDLLGRAGEIDKALAVIKRMPTLNDLPVWLAMLGACRQFGNVKLGRLAFDNAVQIDKYDAAAYVLMTEIYAGAGLQEDARIIKAMREKYSSEEETMYYVD
ncbi:hypothetical protein GOP47_0016149 [Adiantum capillus-veneris]|uniref:Pentatricopeptide repeat-containing protein n=1 Tax=Adiantum capillus-veneris TaxID=13818 RepID=A0A9D4ZBW2_ADICA|nr:hypothetical protein GOP47_0016149 [Adiantum capillus-veneris]